MPGKWEKHWLLELKGVFLVLEKGYSRILEEFGRCMESYGIALFSTKNQTDHGTGLIWVYFCLQKHVNLGAFQSVTCHLLTCFCPSQTALGSRTFASKSCKHCGWTMASWLQNPSLQVSVKQKGMICRYVWSENCKLKPSTINQHHWILVFCVF